MEETMFRKTFLSAVCLAALFLFSSGCQKPAQPAPAPAAPAPAAEPVAKQAEPATVTDIQQKLVENGARLSIDGKMGARTKSALKKFQSKNGLKVTGAADSETLAKLGLE